MRKIWHRCLLTVLIGLLHVGANAQDKKDKEQTYIMECPYEVQNITPPQGKKVKNVILMIGDGMSLMHMYSAWTANRGKLYLDNCQAVGLSKTYCANRLITDSGAGGTAMATGQKTNYHSVGVDTLGHPLKSLVDLANAKGKSTGIAVTCRLWDATPADFCCHNTGRNIFQELNEKGYKTPRSWNELDTIRSGKVFAVPYPADTPIPAERGDLLARASLKGIELLDQNKNGFFMMIEGSQLDDYGHFNDLNLLMQETHDFDRTIGAIYKWAAKDGETLVIVTADHETGGLTLVDGNLKEGKIVCKFSTGGHSGVMVPVYAFGPGFQEFTGIYENTDIFNKIKKILEL